LRAADKATGLMTAEDFLAGMQQRAEAARQQIRAAVKAREKPAGGSE
jgi:hypothetical protein